MEKIKILMADDEQDILQVMSKKIENAGYDVVCASDGQEAWEKIVSESPDVILLDLNMPGKHGFEVLLELRKNPPSEKWQPVIIISARQELTDMQKSFALEADHYITKPCSISDIISAIELMVKLIPHRNAGSESEED